MRALTFFGVLAILNKFGVTLFTDLSVEFAESSTAINKVKLLNDLKEVLLWDKAHQVY